jgi:predicted Zn-dependent protease
LATGTQVRAFRNSEGLSQGFETESFFLDYSLYTKNAASENKAVKGLYAGRRFDPEQWQHSLAQSRGQLEVLKRPNRILEPGEYRTYLAPAAVSALVQMFSWGAVSYGAYKRGDSALRRLIEGQETLSPLFSLEEQFGLGLSPRFNAQGERAPEVTPVIEEGAVKQLMTSSRSAKEYGVPENGADSSEGLRSPSVRAGSLDASAVLSALGTGLYLGNLHYLNWSDLDSARITGMTRYACFWVENGAIVQPIKDMRFDESLYRIFGSELEQLTRTREIEVKTDTYHQRALGGIEVPGALLKNFKFTL